jgi:hypothetical protein
VYPVFSSTFCPTQLLTTAATFLIIGSQSTPTRVHFVGSMPLDTTEEAFTQLARALPGRLHKIPDGETGERHLFIYWQYQSFPIEVRGTMVERLHNEPPAAETFSLTLDYIKATMYDNHAIASYGKF